MEDSRQRIPDDEDAAHWRFGIFYFNRNDKQALVPKRYGSGWTLNFANPFAATFMIAVLLLIIADAAYQVYHAITK